MVASWFALRDGRLEISSMFGGIIYVISEVPIGGLALEFTDVSEYATFTSGRWNFDVDHAPICEIRADFAVLTLPSALTEHIGDLRPLVARFDGLVKTVLQTTADTSSRYQRIVFDVDLPDDDPICGDPIVLGCDHFRAVFVDDGPSAELLCLLMFIAICSLPENVFAELELTCLGLFAAGYAIQRRWNDLSIISQTPNLPPQFLPLWEAANGAQVATALQKVRESGKVENGWDHFIGELAWLTEAPCGNLRRHSFSMPDDPAEEVDEEATESEFTGNQ
jgi:hypothetical protein